MRGVRANRQDDDINPVLLETRHAWTRSDALVAAMAARERWPRRPLREGQQSRLRATV